MDVKHLKHIIAVAQYRGILRASEAIGLSQSALSRSVQSMEKQLGVKLFDRHKSEIIPTPFGQLVIEFGEKIINEANELSRKLDFMQGVQSGFLNIGLAFFSAGDNVGAAIGKMAELYPQLVINLYHKSPLELNALLKSGALDLILVHSDMGCTENSVNIKSLSTQKMLICCSKNNPILMKGKVFLHDLKALPFVCLRTTPEMKNILRKLFPDIIAMERNNSMFSNVTCEDLQATKLIVKNSNAFAWVLEQVVKDELEAGDLVEIPILDMVSYSETPAVFQLRNRTLTPAVEKFLELLT